MVRTKREKVALATEVGRDLTETSLRLHDAIAAKLGLGPSDLRCLRLVRAADAPVRAGHLAEQTGLTTGAITGVLDRLEREGYVRREKDPGDRRQVLVHAAPQAQMVEEILEADAQVWGEVAAQFSAEAFEAARGVAIAAAAALGDRAALLRDDGAPSGKTPATGELSAPLAGAPRGVLDLPRGAAHLHLASTTEPLLYALRFQGAQPKVSHRDGRVSIDFPRPGLRLLGGVRSSARLDLQASIPWTIRTRGGAVLRFELASIQLEELTVQGGLHDASFHLGPPRGTVPIRISGGAAKLELLRPARVPARVSIRGGASRLAIDNLHLGAVGGGTQWESPDYAGAEDRYEISIAGGASGVKIGHHP